MRYDFDLDTCRSSTDCEKWQRYDKDVLPLWVADMDFRAPEPVIAALHRRIDHGVFGYGHEPGRLRSLLADRLRRLYGWQVAPEAFVLLPGVITGLNLACRAFALPGDAVIVSPPVYTPILTAPGTAGLARVEVPLRDPGDLRYTLDMDELAGAITPATRLLMLCNPHNPVGRAFLPDELARLAETCAGHDLLICSDEIHCDLIFPEHRHTPIASLSPEIAARTVTLMAPSKTFNVPGLKCAFAVIPDAKVRARFQAARAGLVSEPNILGLAAMEAAYTDGGDWLAQCLAYLAENRNLVVRYVAEHLPGIRTVAPEATFLAWLDCRALDLPGSPYRFFLEHARVALSDGAVYGSGGAGFVRLNFACPRALLLEALDRMAAALRS